MRRAVAAVLSTALALTALSAVTLTGPAGAAPPPLTDSLVASVQKPTALAFKPGGALLVTNQLGQLFVVRNGTPKQVLDLSSRICTNSERGLLGLAVDPAFTSNQYIYLYFTLKGPNGECGTAGTTTAPPAPTNIPANHVARFLLNPDDTVTGETTIIDRLPSYNGNHNGGDIVPGPDGKLYVSVGDGGCDLRGGGCGAGNDVSRDVDVGLGKVLRVNTDGTIPSDNPYANDTPTDPCGNDGFNSTGKHCPETWAQGFRNPFRMAFGPGPKLYVNDVGAGTWEEVDDVTSGGDYGWNVREGHCATGSTSDCGPPPTGMTNPIHDYAHSTGCYAITGSAFVPSSAPWPADYQGDYLFADFGCGKIFRLQPSGVDDLVTNLGANSAVHMEFGPDAALYYTTYAGGGSIRKLTVNTPPPSSTTTTTTTTAPPTTTTTTTTTTAPVRAAPTAAPGNVSAAPTGGDGAARVSYALVPDAANGGSAITKYRATCRASGQTNKFAEDTSAPFGPITVSGMTNGVTYTCKVRAYNVVGAGPESSGANVRVGAPTAPPSVTNGPGSTAGSIKVSWTAAATPSTAPALAHTVTCAASGSTKTVTVGNVLTKTMGGLDRTKTYTCKVAATNKWGTGPFRKAPTGTKPR